MEEMANPRLDMDMPAMTDGDAAQSFDEIKEQLGWIAKGELSLVSDYDEDAYLDEEYGGWYDDDEEHYDFSDPDGVVDIVESAIDFVDDCLNTSFVAV